MGEFVEANYKGKGEWKRGRVKRIIEEEGNFYIKYDDGGAEVVSGEMIRKADWPENNCNNKTTLFQNGDKVDVKANDGRMKLEYGSLPIKEITAANLSILSHYT